MLFALGIRHVGKRWPKLAQALGNVEAFKVATEEGLLALDEVGPVIANQLVEQFSDPQFLALLDDLSKAGLKMEAEKQEALGDALVGEVVVVSGVFRQVSRNEAKALVAQHGGRLASSISSKTTLVGLETTWGQANVKGGLGVAIVSEAELGRTIGPNDFEGPRVRQFVRPHVANSTWTM